MHYPINPIGILKYSYYCSITHYRDRGNTLFPECASSLTEPCDSDALSIQST